jgi:hypothetical protein
LSPASVPSATTVSLPSKRPAAASAVAPASATAPARLDERVGGMREPRLRVPDLLTGHLDQMAARRTHRVDDVGRVEERPHLKPGDRRRDGLVEQCRRADERPADGGRAIRLYGNEPGRAVELRRPVEEPLPRGREEAAAPNREVDDVYLGNPLAQLVRDGLRTVHRLGAESPRRHERQQVVPSGDANHFLGCGERACGLEAETAQFENARAEAAKLHQLRSWCAGNDEEGHRQPRPRGVGRDCGAAVARGRPDKPGEARSSATATAAILSL